MHNWNRADNEWRRALRYGAALLVFAVLLLSCGKGDTPEEQVKRFVAAGEEAVEARSIGDVQELISEQYEDERGLGKRDFVALTARYLLTNKNIHVLTRIGSLEFPSGDRAVVQLYAAMTGQNVSDLDALLNMQADLYIFDLELAREDKEWKLVRARWRPANPEDFF